MKLEIKGISGHFMIWPPYPDGNVRLELHTDDGGMAAADFSPDQLEALWAGVRFKIEQAKYPPLRPEWPNSGGAWGEMPEDKRPTFWATKDRGYVRPYICQLIFRTDEDAVAYVRERMPNQLEEALAAWRSVGVPV